jgi:hypothetical protein
LNNCLTKDGLSTPNTPMTWGLSNGQVLNLTRGSDGVGFGIARTGGSNNPALQFILADNTGVGIGFSGTPWMTFVQAGGVTFAQPVAFAAGSGVSAAFQGVANANTVTMTGSSTSGQSFGLSINAGTTSADYALLVRSQSGGATFLELFGDGHGSLGPSALLGLSWAATGAYTLTAPTPGSASDRAFFISGSGSGDARVGIGTASAGNAQLNLDTFGVQNWVLGNTRSDGSFRLSASQALGTTDRLIVTPGGNFTTLAPSSGTPLLINRTGDGDSLVFAKSGTNFLDIGSGNNFLAGQAEMFTFGTIPLGIGSSGAAAVHLYSNSLLALTIDTSQNININNGAGSLSPVYAGIPQNSQAGTTYGLVLADANKHVFLTNAGAVAVTIPANASVAYPVGTAITIVSNSGASSTIAITTDTLVWAAGGGTGTRTLASKGLATIIKVSATAWWISGTGLS